MNDNLKITEILIQLNMIINSKIIRNFVVLDVLKLKYDATNITRSSETKVRGRRTGESTAVLSRHRFGVSSSDLPSLFNNKQLNVMLDTKGRSTTCASKTAMPVSETINVNVFNYEGQNITFRTSDGVLMVNATEMAKPFGKLPVHFLRNSETKAYILALSQYANSHTGQVSNSQLKKNKLENLRIDQIVFTKNGGYGNGTWIHELLAIRFAQWLSPEFSVWVDIHIKQLLTTGKTEMVKPVNKGTYLGLHTLNFLIYRYSNTIECTPDKFIPVECMEEVKKVVDKMCYILKS